MPPDTHRQNIAEQAIQTHKGHLSLLWQKSATSNSFPIQWNLLVLQIVLTLNLLQQMNAEPKVSAYDFLHGTFDHDQIPLAPMGCAQQFHAKSMQQKTG